MPNQAPTPPSDPLDRIQGALLGVALADAWGAPHEGGPLEGLLWRVIGTRQGRRRWTDDTQMTFNVAASLAELGRVDQDDLARRFACSYRWSRGYGPGAAKILKRIRRGHHWTVACRAVYAQGSFGNGAAMRAVPIGLFFAAQGKDAIIQAARSSAAITHAHPQGQEGAVLIALVAGMLFRGLSPTAFWTDFQAQDWTPAVAAKLSLAAQWLSHDKPIAHKTVARQLGHAITAADSCPTAVYIALRHLSEPFIDLLDFTRHVGGDVDTIGAMAGGLWGAARGLGALPMDHLAQLEDADRLLREAGAFAAAVDGHRSRQSY
ncbi:ADP-ribosyl-[dinitrogen reductase] glycohydrolase [Thiorhodovibrio winogradskyi]|uniref:ADP-ribosyl-[dinitrogen reductase] glycohydrolase n=1 Tax=Thiorhodovibrio winogradskyi TaxID=77007 RepID=A0ABZ0SB19_9GAMM|nr:ADP-ribosylglycohydrolase family protein [Thiorhodovibrio winogradskyi]